MVHVRGAITHQMNVLFQYYDSRTRKPRREPPTDDDVPSHCISSYTFEQDLLVGGHRRFGAVLESPSPESNSFVHFDSTFGQLSTRGSTG